AHHLVEGHARRSHGAPGDENAAAIFSRNIRVSLRGIPAIAVLQTVRAGFGREGPAVEPTDEVAAIAAVEYPAWVLPVAVQGDLEKLRALARAGNSHVAHPLPL